MLIDSFLKQYIRNRGQGFSLSLKFIKDKPKCSTIFRRSRITDSNMSLEGEGNRTCPKEILALCVPG